jgi:hypothetical protein
MTHLERIGGIWGSPTSEARCLPVRRKSTLESAIGARHGLGPAGDGKTPGFFLPAVVAVDRDGEAVLGLLDRGDLARTAGQRPSQTPTGREGMTTSLQKRPTALP